jgi:hypothetical protein
MTVEIVIAATPDQKKSAFGEEIDLFTKHVDAIGDVLLLLVFALQDVAKHTQDNLTQFETEKCEVSEIEGKRSVKVPNNSFREWKRLARKYEHYALSRTLLPRSLLISLLAQYDAYLGRLLRTVFVRKPEILNGSDKKISFETLSQFTSLEAAREYILEKEVEAILRSSHSDHFKWMEKTFDLPLTKDLQSWPTFVELAERRNLFVHTDGVVSSQYIAVCRLHKCQLEESVREGERLHIPQPYFKTAHECIYEIGVKLGHVLWRKLFPDERAQADANLIRLTFELIDNGKYDLAIRLLDFACSDFKKFANEANQLTLTVNRAQAYKWKGDEERCNKIMRSVDWTAKGDQFRLADAVLAEDWTLVSKVMRRIGRDGPVDQTDYRDWPIFRNLRKQETFLTDYEDIFGEAFSAKSEVKPSELLALEQGSELEAVHPESDDALP